MTAAAAPSGAAGYRTILSTVRSPEAGTYDEHRQPEHSDGHAAEIHSAKYRFETDVCMRKLCLLCCCSSGILYNYGLFLSNYTIMVCFCLFISSYLTMFEKLKQKSRRSLSGSFISPYSDALCQKSNLPSNQDSSSLIGTRTCSMLSRSRIVTDWSVSESKSYVMQNGVPISSCLL